MLLSPALHSRSFLCFRFDFPSSPPQPKKSLTWTLSCPPFFSYRTKLHPSMLHRWSISRRRIEELDTRRRIVAVVALSLVESGTSGNGPKAVDQSVSPIKIGAGATSLSGNGSFRVALPLLPPQNAESQAPPLLFEDLTATEGKISTGTLTKERAFPDSMEKTATVTSCSEAEMSIVEAEKLRRKKISMANKGRVPWNKGRKFVQGTPQISEISEPVQKSRDMDDTASLLEREKMRRQRISCANKGKVPWNKGRQHSEETILRIKARTLEAMQDPKVREKLRMHGEKQSPKTRLKISNSLSHVWKVKRKLKTIQETCFKEWKEMIAEVARVGDDGDVVYQWNSYMTIMKELRDAWTLSLKEARNTERKMPRPRIRKPHSLELKAKISEAIKAKWADPSYRFNVEKGIHAHLVRRGVQPGRRRERRAKSNQKRTASLKPQEKKPRGALLDDVGSEDFEATSDTQCVTSLSKSAKVLPVYRDSLTDDSESAAQSKLQVSPVHRDSPTDDTESGTVQSISGNVIRVYRDPLTNERLERLKHIRAIRLSEEARRREVTERARILIAEAERAARALEAAAVKDKSALGPLLETRRLLAEAAQSFQTAGLGKDAPLGSLKSGES